MPDVPEPERVFVFGVPIVLGVDLVLAKQMFFRSIRVTQYVDVRGDAVDRNLDVANFQRALEIWKQTVEIRRN